ncbi:hypothetical protein LTSEMIS_2946, partial [Salmonella enterica subsp. enterica serovar Mississippi str. A4-633]
AMTTRPSIDINSNILLLPIFDSVLYLNHFRKKIYLV